MMDFMICAATNLFRMYIIYRFVSIFFMNQNVSKVVELCAYAFFYIANTALFWIFHTVWINVLCNLVCMGIIIGLHTRSLRTILFVTCSLYIINMGCDIAATTLFIEYEDGEAHSQVYAVVSVLFIFICELLAEKILTNRRKLEVPKKYPLILVPAGSILMLWLLLYSDTCSAKGLAIVSMGLLGIQFLMLYLYGLLLRSVTEQYESELLRQQVRIYANQLEVITQSEEKIKALRHDLKHHMNEIKLLANQYDATEIKKYIDQMENYIHNQDEIIASGNQEIDSVLNYMLQKARNELKTVKSEIVLPEEMKHFFDMNILIGNLLENAIREASLTEQKYMYIHLKFQKGILRIQIENSYLTASEKEKSKLLQHWSGGEKEQHGIGLKNVRKIVEMHNGTMETSMDNDIYCVKLMLYMDNQETDEQ